MALDDKLPHRGTYIRGSSRQRLPELLSKLGRVDLLIHDSLHSERNLRLEVDRAWQVIPRGGAIVVDDLDISKGFRSFTRAYSGHDSLVCESESNHPDLWRFNKRGLFSIVCKP